jgi:hypothetical protein
MKKILKLLSSLLAAISLLACGIFNINPDGKTITPSDNIVTENRAVNGFTGVDMSTIGTVTITQGGKEALVITGSDNLVELVTTDVRNGVLVIAMENVNVQSMKKENILTFEITVKELDSLTVSGLGTVEMSGLETQSLALVMSGAGAIALDQLKAEDVNVDISGVGGITVEGIANHVDVSISGAGELNATDLEARTANANISGLGTATVWVTDELTGEISGAGSVLYYGEPKTNTKSTGVGRFEARGKK